MLSVNYKDSMYVVRDGPDVVGFFNNVFDAISSASVEADGKGFLVNCVIAGNTNTSKTFYTCPKCTFPVKVTGTLPSHDYEEYSKDVYANCPYCDVEFVIIWMRHRYLQE